MSTKINLALAGSGTFAQNAYLPALLANTSTIHLHSLWSRSSSSTDALISSAKSIGLLKSEGDVKVYNGTDANGLDAVLADPEVDAVAFILPITAQPPLIVKAWQAGKHVLSEKPVGKDTEAAKELIRLYESEYKPKGLIWRVAESECRLDSEVSHSAPAFCDPAVTHGLLRVHNSRTALTLRLQSRRHLSRSCVDPAQYP